MRDEKVVQFDACVFTLSRKGYRSPFLFVKLCEWLLGFNFAELFFQQLWRRFFFSILFFFFSILFLFFVLVAFACGCSLLRLFFFCVIRDLAPITTIASAERLVEDVSFGDHVGVDLILKVFFVVLERGIVLNMSLSGHPLS